MLVGICVCASINVLKLKGGKYPSVFRTTSKREMTKWLSAMTDNATNI